MHKKGIVIPIWLQMPKNTAQLWYFMSLLCCFLMDPPQQDSISTHYKTTMKFIVHLYLFLWTNGLIYRWQWTSTSDSQLKHMILKGGKWAVFSKCITCRNRDRKRKYFHFYKTLGGMWEVSHWYLYTASCHTIPNRILEVSVLCSTLNSCLHRILICN